MVHRVREITDAFGSRLTLSVEPHPIGALITLERSDKANRPRILFDAFGAELLAGYIMASRLALPGSLPEERFGGNFPSAIRLSHDPKVSIEVESDAVVRPFDIPAPFWDRLYAELCLVVAHARELGRRGKAAIH